MDTAALPSHVVPLAQARRRRSALARLLLVAAAGLLPFPLPASAQANESPDALVRRVTAEVLQAIQSDAALRAGDRARAVAFAETHVLPYVDFARMTRLATGKHWRRASADQQQALVRGFRALLVRTYASSLRTYEGQTMVVDPSAAPTSEDARVRGRYQRPGRPDVAVEYALARSGDGWRIYDIVMDGISLVTTWRSSFAAEIDRGGIDGLIARLGDPARDPDPTALRDAAR